jgi:UDP-N-acetylglucosamine 1-carboxyvinyltransferase
MASFIIEGKAPLNGEVTPSGNKNAAFPLISAALLTDQPVTLHNLPNIGDVRTMLAIVEEMGVEITRHTPHDVTLRAGKLTTTTPDPVRFAKIRGALVLMGSLLAREGEVNLAQPGGDQIGRRRVDTHILALQALGAQFKFNGKFVLSAPQLRGADMLLDEASVTATENAILAAVRAEGVTVIRNAASEPHVQDFVSPAGADGANISGIGSNLLTIQGSARWAGRVPLSADLSGSGQLYGPVRRHRGRHFNQKRLPGTPADGADGLRAAGHCPEIGETICSCRATKCWWLCRTSAMPSPKLMTPPGPASPPI